MSQGFLKVAVVEIQSDYFTPTKQFNLRITADDANFTYTNQLLKKYTKKQSEKILKCCKPYYHLLPLTDHLQVKIFENQQTDTRFGYFKIPTNKLYQLPHKNHMINTRCIWMQRQENQVNNDMPISAIVKLSVIYLDNVTGTLLIDIKQASLERDTQAIGEMDPYLECKIGDVQSKTDVCEAAGKNPKWNQVLSFLLESIPSQIVFQIKDKDMINDDVVGCVTLNPQQEQILKESNQPIQRDIVINYQGKRAGIVKISTFLTLSLSKPGNNNKNAQEVEKSQKNNSKEVSHKQSQRQISNKQQPQKNETESKKEEKSNA